jgi:hypothetical protein
MITTAIMPATATCYSHLELATLSGITGIEMILISKASKEGYIAGVNAYKH